MSASYASSMHYREATHEISGYIDSKCGRRSIRITYVPSTTFYRFTRQGRLLAKHQVYPILRTYPYKNIKIFIKRSIPSIVYIGPVSDSHVLGLGLDKCLPRPKHISDVW